MRGRVFLFLFIATALISAATSPVLLRPFLPAPPTPAPAPVDQDRIDALEARVRELGEEVASLRAEMESRGNSM